MMFGMMGQFLPAAAGALLATNPVLLGIGALFGGMGLSRTASARCRCGARRRVRRSASSSTTCSSRSPTRSPAVVATSNASCATSSPARLGELQKTYTDAAKSSAGGRPADASGAASQRASELDQSITMLKKIEAALGVRPMSAAPAVGRDRCGRRDHAAAGERAAGRCGRRDGDPRADRGSAAASPSPGA